MSRPIICLASVLAALAAAATADAQVVPQDWVDAATHAAQLEWHVQTPALCHDAMPTVRQMPLTGMVAGAVEGAEADFTSCTITFNTAAYWSGPYNFCVVMVHEWGHLELGPDAFAASNPADPAHSLSPVSVMQESPAIFGLQIGPCETMQNLGQPPSVGSLSVMLPPRAHHRRRRHGSRRIVR